ncbi:membrane lipoprotein lipid attachment site-containing protein [Serratia grimesii]|uniref:membrane lipoprotein lipid attachment site-containing protein n=1 Tax=Serratia grimesii TaxID=82995 RepID=UPI0022403293|nr:membrane lipoprotein lipid attachment site-containing protein [Serratia grimesii]
MKKIVFVAVAIAIISGCATKAVLPNQAKLAPKERVFKYQSPLVDSAKLIIVRDSGFLGGGCFFGVYVDGERAAKLNPGERVNFYLPAGEHNIAMKGEGKVCIADEVPVGRDINLKPNQTKAVRLFADPSGNLDVKPLPLN